MTNFQWRTLFLLLLLLLLFSLTFAGTVLYEISAAFFKSPRRILQNNDEQIRFHWNSRRPNKRVHLFVVGMVHALRVSLSPGPQANSLKSATRRSNTNKTLLFISEQIERTHSASINLTTHHTKKKLMIECRVLGRTLCAVFWQLAA